MDIELLALVANRDKYTRFKPYVQEALLGQEARLVYNNVGAYFTERPECKDIDWEAFKSWFFIYCHHSIKDKNADSFHIIFDKLKVHKVSATDHELLHHFITRDYCTRISQVATKVRDGDEALKNMVDLVAEAEHTLQRAVDPSVLFVSSDSTEIMKVAASAGFEWQLEELNISLGPIRIGDFIIVGARPETGKTTFLAHQLSYIATQIKDKRPIIWVNNEDRSEKVMLRVKQAALGISIKDYMLDTAGNDALFKAAMGGITDRILILANNSGCNNVDSLNSIFREYNPALIVFDQLDKVQGFTWEDQNHIQLEKKYNWARDLSHEYGPVIAVSQADATAHNTRYITDLQLAGSKVGKQGEADAIITIGRIEDTGFEYTRFINVPKNKLFGGPRSDEKFRHGKWEVKIHPDIARYEGHR